MFLTFHYSGDFN